MIPIFYFVMNQLVHWIQKPVCKLWHIQELSKEKLVIMVTHNPELAHEYADRIIEFSDGQIRRDSRPHIEHEKRTFRIETHKMKFTTALRLSFNNIRTKRRTF